MKKIKLAIIIVILCVSNTGVLADLRTDRSVIKNNLRADTRASRIDGERVVAIARFQEPIAGDLYIAAQINGALTFIANEGNEFSSIPVPFRANSILSEDIIVLNIVGQGIPPGRYPLFKVVTQPGTDPLDFRNWIGGLGGLRSINFIVGLSDDESLDFDDDGFPDDDLDRDGFHDDDTDRDGFHDGDLDRDGFHDDEETRNRFARVKRRRGETGDDDQNQNELDDDDLDELDTNTRTRSRARGM